MGVKRKQIFFHGKHNGLREQFVKQRIRKHEEFKEVYKRVFETQEPFDQIENVEWRKLRGLQEAILSQLYLNETVIMYSLQGEFCRISVFKLMYSALCTTLCHIKKLCNKENNIK